MIEFAVGRKFAGSSAHIKWALFLPLKKEKACSMFQDDDIAIENAYETHLN